MTNAPSDRTRIKISDFEHGVTSYRYDGRNMVPAWVLMLVFDYLAMRSFGSLAVFLFLFASIGHTFICYALIVFKRNHNITISGTFIIWETLFKKRVIPLKEVAFVGIGVDDRRNYLNMSHRYPRSKIIHLLWGNFSMAFNPELFYIKHTVFELSSDDSEQNEWKLNDETIISHLEKNCTFPISEREKKKKQFLANCFDFLMIFIGWPLWVLPMLPAMIIQLLQR